MTKGSAGATDIMLWATFNSIIAMTSAASCIQSIAMTPLRILR